MAQAWRHISCFQAEKSNDLASVSAWSGLGDMWLLPALSLSLVLNSQSNNHLTKWGFNSSGQQKNMTDDIFFYTLLEHKGSNLYFGKNRSCCNVYLYFFYWVQKMAAHISMTTMATQTKGDKLMLSTGEFLWNFLSLQQDFVTTISCTKSHQIELVQLLVVTKFCCGDKDLHKNSPVHMKHFFTAMCHTTCRLAWTQGVICCSYVLQQHVA